MYAWAYRQSEYDSVSDLWVLSWSTIADPAAAGKAEVFKSRFAILVLRDDVGHGHQRELEAAFAGLGRAG
jgi:hypothetical protein